MGTIQNKCCTTRNKALAYRGNSGRSAGSDSLVLGLGVGSPPSNRHQVVADVWQKNVWVGDCEKENFAFTRQQSENIDPFF